MDVENTVHKEFCEEAFVDKWSDGRLSIKANGRLFGSSE